MKIFCIGLPKTGTHSILSALKELGFKTKHYPMIETIHKTLQKVDAIAENATIRMWKTLDIIYPNSKFILTVRDKKDWLYSCKCHLDILRPNPNKQVKEVRRKTLGCVNFNQRILSKRYDKYMNDVKSYFKKRNDLLVLDFDKGDGYEKLCKFLGLPITYKKFPHMNKRKK